MAFEFFPGLSQNFSQLLDDVDDYNVIIKVGENQNIKEFRAHSIILRARSPYFKRALSQNWITKKNDKINFTKPNISPTTFDMIIKYMYTGVLDLNGKDGSEILNLLIASDELLIEELVSFVQKYLLENQTEWLHQNFVNILHTVFQLENFKQFYDGYLESICENPELFFSSPSFLMLEKNILLRLIKRDDLQIDDSELWNYLIKWGVAQTTELRGKDMTNLSEWNKKDFLALENTLNQFILNIRFFDIPSKDFYKNIWPYKKLLSKVLVENILSFHMAETEPAEQNILPSRRGKISAVDSKIIKRNHAAILVNWIQGKKTNVRIPRNRKYIFNLIYCRSRDGYDIDTIRRRCNGQEPCILIVKIKENEAIIGGYNPLGWGHFDCWGREYWSSTTESFIFSFGNGNNSKISRVANSNRAIYESDNQNIALSFGNSDLVINNNSTGSCKQRYYESSILDIDNFSIEDMEIFGIHQE